MLTCCFDLILEGQKKSTGAVYKIWRGEGERGGDRRTLNNIKSVIFLDINKL